MKIFFCSSQATNSETDMFKILHKDLMLLFSDKRALAFKFLLPVLLISVFVLAFSGMRSDNGDPGIQKINLPVVNLDSSETTRYIVQQLSQIPSFKLEHVDSMQADKLVRTGKRIGALVLHKGFSDAFSAQTPLPWELVYQEGRDMELGILKSILLPNLRKLNPFHTPDANTSDNSPANSGAPLDLSGMQLIFRPLAQEPAFRNDPWLVQPVVGIALILLLFNVSGIGGSLLEEKETGTLKRLLQSPLKPAGLFWAKMLQGMFISFIQLSIMFLAAMLIFGLHIEYNIPGLLLIMLATTFSFSSFGLLLAGISKTRGQMQGIAIAIILLMSALGGSMIPIFIMPDFMQKLARLSVNYWGLEAFYDLWWRQLPLRLILPKIGILVSIGLLITSVAYLFFRRFIQRLAS